MSRRKNRLRFWKRWGRMEEERGALQWVLMNMWWSASKGSTPICGAQTSLSLIHIYSEGHFLWPGFGDNFRVLEWILKRCEGKVDAKETAIGYVPYAEDINLEGIQDFDIETLKSILEVDKAAWAKEAEGIEEFYKQFGDKLPQELRNQLETLKKNCAE